MKVTYKGPHCYHPGTGLDLAPGEMDVTEDQALQLEGILDPSALARKIAAFKASLSDLVAPIANAADAVAYHAEGAEVYHTEPGCQTGNNIEPENRRRGTGDLPLCSSCGKTEAAPRRKRKE